VWDAGDTAGSVALSKKEKNQHIFEIVKISIYINIKNQTTKKYYQAEKTVNPFFGILFLTSNFLSGRQ
jgi:hypothetical protein